MMPIMAVIVNTVAIYICAVHMHVASKSPNDGNE